MVSSIISDKKGIVLIFVIIFMLLIVLGTVSFATLIQRDITLMYRAKEREQARLMAEAGVYEGIADILKNGFDSRADFSDSLDTGTYDVTYAEISNRYLITSVGTVNNTSVTVTAEIGGGYPTALNYFSGAGNDMHIKIHTNVNDAYIIGDIHANNEMQLVGQPNSRMDVTGDVSATGIILEGNKHNEADSKDTNIYINGLNNDQATVEEGAYLITFPGFNYEEFEQEAIDNGIYYDTSQTFNGVTLSPANGMVYVEGDVTIQNDVTLNGSLVADNITLQPHSTLYQVKLTETDVIIAKDGDVNVKGHLNVQKALVFSSQDIRTSENWGPIININGLMLALRDVKFWNYRASIYYTYDFILPPHMDEESSELGIISWNR